MRRASATSSRNPVTLLFLLGGCGPLTNTSLTRDVPAAELDLDLDGYAAAVDCDDSNPAVWPGAEERCDGLDNNCNNEIDEVDSVDAALWFRDSDGDGFGNPAVGVAACEAPASFVGDATDCDDSQPAVYPGADEICWDGFSNDCDADPEEVRVSCDLEGDIRTEGANVVIRGESTEHHAGVAAAAGNGNGNDVADLAIGAPNADGGSGAVYVVFDRSSDGGAPYSSLDLEDADAKVSGRDGQALGWSVSFFQETGSAGVGGLLVGAPYTDDVYEDQGAVYLFLQAPRDDTDLEAADHVFYGQDAGAMVGFSIAPAGDINGDNYPDFLIGAPGVGSSGDGAGGAVFLIFGQCDCTEYPDTLGEAAVEVSDGVSEGFGGTSVAAAGDVDGDGADDLVFGSAADSWEGGEAGASAGTAQLIFGDDSAGALGWEIADTSRVVGDSGEAFGWAVDGAGDLNGDGYDDVVVGAPGTGSDGGSVVVVDGGSSHWSDLWAKDAAAHITGDGSVTGIGWTVEGAGDVDGDGFDDLLVGTSSLEVAAYLLLGPFEAEVSVDEAHARFLGDASLGVTPLSVGDLDADGGADFGLGLGASDVAGIDSGAMFLFLGSGGF